jgi:hypothetical protein
MGCGVAPNSHAANGDPSAVRLHVRRRRVSVAGLLDHRFTSRHPVLMLQRGLPVPARHSVGGPPGDRTPNPRIKSSKITHAEQC